ncbi:MAG: RND family transporter, partial [Candidatus Krumholzibacteriia bacterium]
MTRLTRHAVAHPARVVSIALLLCLALAPGLARLEIRTDGHALVPPSAPEVRRDREIREAFGLEDPIVVLVETAHADGIYNLHTLRLVETLTRRIERLPGIGAGDVSSLATETSDRYRPGTLRFYPLLEPSPGTASDLERVRDDVGSIQLYTGTLVAADGKSASILVDVPAGADRLALIDTIRSVADAARTEHETTQVIGAPVAEALLGTHILEDLGVPASVIGRGVPRDPGDAGSVPHNLYELRRLLGRKIGLLPIALAVMACVFLAGFRRPLATFLPLLEVGACLTVVFGLMGWLGVPIYLTIAVLPVILTCIGVADEIHVLSRYGQMVREQGGGNPPARVLEAMREVSSPIIRTSVTTAVGFVSFALSPIPAVRAFGIFMAVGILYCMLWSLAVTPALLSRIPAARIVAPHGGHVRAGELRGSAWLVRWTDLVLRRRRAVLAGALAVAIAAPLGVRRLAVQDSWIDGFDPHSTFHRATRAFDERFFGTHILQVCVGTGYQLLLGEIPVDAVEHHRLTLPVRLDRDPAQLAGSRVRVARVAPPEDPDPRTPALTRLGAWTSWVETATATEDRLVVTTPPRTGSPLLLLRLQPDETVLYEIDVQRLKAPDVLRRVADLQSFLAAQRDCKVGGVLGPVDYVTTTSFMVRRRAPGSRRIPETAKEVDLLWRHYGRVRGEDRLRQVVDRDFGRTLVTVFLKDANYVDTGRLMDAIREYEAENLAPHGMSVSFAGDVAVSQALIHAVVTTQVRSLLLSLLGILAVTILMSRSLRWGLYAVIPCALAVLL